MEILVVERKKQIEIEDQEIVRREKELAASVKLPAEAARYKVETLAEGERYGSDAPTLCTHSASLRARANGTARGARLPFSMWPASN